MVNAELDEEQVADISQRLHETATRFAEERELGDRTEIRVRRPEVTLAGAKRRLNQVEIFEDP